MTDSKRSKVLIALRALSRRRPLLRMVRNMRGDRNRARDVVDILIWKKLRELESHRYLYHNRHRRAKYNKFVMKGKRI